MPEAPKEKPKPTDYNYSVAENNKKKLEFIEDVTKNADEVQKRVLAEILSRNAHVEYLNRHGLNGHTDRDTFKKIMPVITYEDILPDINRIANGDMSPILCSEPISEFLTSSGTSGGERKVMPTIEEELGRRSLLYSLLMPVMSQFVPGLDKGKGIPPVGAVFASGFIRAIRFLEKHWALLCHDIRTGTVNPLITDRTVRMRLWVLKPDPDLAGFIESECGKDSWQGIIVKLWPNTKYIDVIVTGTMSQYIPTLDYYSNGLPLVCTINNGVNNSIDMPKSLNEKEQQELVDLVDVKLGQEYELVVTTYAGLYRYRVGDVLRVAGFKNNAPQFNFICRKNVVLSIDTDKTDEVELQNAVKNAIGHLMPFDARLTEYTSYADTTTIPGHYVLYWELTQNGSIQIPPSVFEDCCLTIEESLDSVYRQNRAFDAIGPLEIKIVEADF
ncbi:hypothetical protein DH2020_033410 [Rehmannia glutinosa]|uniref:Indole-3-acetic acid-amido synthetase n=1 Tax=Rehmannia glutinosa TaxID=99300 RepID=A0ABR0VD90_REHGL